MSRGEYNEAYYKGKGNGSEDGCFNCGSKFHRVRDCPLGKGKNKKGSHNYKGKGKSKGFWRWRPNFKGKSKGKSKHPWRSKGKGKGKGFGRKGHYYAYQEEDNYKPRGGLSISEGIPDASTPQEVATSSKEVKTTKKAESFVIHTSSEDEDFKKPTEGYSGQPEYTTKDHYDKKLKMNFMVFNMKKEETQMSYHTIHGQERYGLLIDPGAASGLVGSEDPQNAQELLPGRDGDQPQQDHSSFRHFRKQRVNSRRGHVDHGDRRTTHHLHGGGHWWSWKPMPSTGWQPDSSSIGCINLDRLV